MFKKPKTISVSLIKEMIYKGDILDFCPPKLYALSIAKTHDYSSLNMLKGRYFETLGLGCSRNNDNIYDLPRKQVSVKQKKENPNFKGNKTIDQIRIDYQVENFKRLCDKYKVNVCDKNVQIHIKKVWEKNRDIMLSGHLDIFPTSLYHKFYIHNNIIIDLKLTGDITSTFGKFGWGRPANIDPIQGIFYHYLVKDIDMELNSHLEGVLFHKEWINKYNGILPIFNDTPFYNWVFDYKKEPLSNDFFPVEITSLRIQELHESIRKVVGLIDTYTEHGYPPNPNKENCANCPLSYFNGGECNDSKDINTI